MGNLIHDKGERAGLGRILEVMSFNNRNYKLYSTCHNGIIPVIIDADGVNPNDDDIATKIIKTKNNCCLPRKQTHHQTSLIVNLSWRWRRNNGILF